MDSSVFAFTVATAISRALLDDEVEAEDGLVEGVDPRGPVGRISRSPETLLGLVLVVGELEVARVPLGEVLVVDGLPEVARDRALPGELEVELGRLEAGNGFFGLGVGQRGSRQP